MRFVLWWKRKVHLFSKTIGAALVSDIWNIFTEFLKCVTIQLFIEFTELLLLWLNHKQNESIDCSMKTINYIFQCSFLQSSIEFSVINKVRFAFYYGIFFTLDSWTIFDVMEEVRMFEYQICISHFHNSLECCRYTMEYIIFVFFLHAHLSIRSFIFHWKKNQIGKTHEHSVFALIRMEIDHMSDFLCWKNMNTIFQ